MLYTYQIELPEEGATSFIKTIQVGPRIFQFQFQWAIASEEQYNNIDRYLTTKAKSDPLVTAGAYNTDYNYEAYYLQINQWLQAETGRTIDQWIQEQDTLPRSILAAPEASRVIMIRERIQECITLYPVLQLYSETLHWQFKCTYNGQVTAGCVRTGGWYLNRDGDAAFRFVSDLTNIDKDHLNNVTIEFEVRA